MTSPDTPPTLDDVARMADVSTATVSRCINMPDKVSKPTLAKVRSVIDTLGYTPNFAARVMAAKRTFTIGAIIPTIDNAIFARGLQSFQEELHKHSYTLLVSSSAYDPTIEEEQIRTLVARGADGLLLIGHDRDPAIYAYLARQNVPVLSAWSYQIDAATPSIGFDNRSAMRALTEQIITMGHRKIAMISGITHNNDRARDRMLGVRDAMRMHSLDPDTLTTAQVPYDVTEGAKAFAQLMSAKPSVVLCGNDVLAAGALRAARSMGLNVPDDISITGFDDLEIAQVVSPKLTTVRVPHQQMGRLAAQEIIAMITEKRAGISKRLDANIIHRGSARPIHE